MSFNIHVMLITSLMKVLGNYANDEKLVLISSMKMSADIVSFEKRNYT